MAGGYWVIPYDNIGFCYQVSKPHIVSIIIASLSAHMELTINKEESHNMASCIQNNKYTVNVFMLSCVAYRINEPLK